MSIHVRSQTARVQATLPRPAHDARRTWLERDGIALRLETEDEGLVGRAEATPLPGFSHESVESVERALAGIDWTEVDLASDDPLSIAERIVPSTVPSARFAVEAALVDLSARIHHRSCAMMLAERRAADSISSAALIDDPDSAPARARAAVQGEAGALKIKIGRSELIETEIALVHMLRRELGESVKIRADANGMLNEASAPLIAALAEIGCELLEEPYPVELLLEHPELPLPVGLDESVARDPIRSLRAIEQRRAEVLVLKPAMVGGLARSLALAEAATRRGGRAIVSHLYDGPNSFAACGHLALALGDSEIHGLARYAGLDAWVDHHGEPIAVPGGIDAYRIYHRGTPGLG